MAGSGVRNVVSGCGVRHVVSEYDVWCGWV